MEQEIQSRIAKMDREQADDLKELFSLLSREEDETERQEIVRTMWELLFPESLTKVIDDIIEDEASTAASRAKLEQYRKKVGDAIRTRRDTVGMTQVDLAEAAGLPQSHISRLECGKHTPTHITLEKVAAALGVAPSQLDPGCDP